VTGYGVNPEITRLMDQVDVYLVPIMNPDGYEYSWTTNRLWRKNRRDNGMFPVPSWGVDLNRNWDDHWGLVGSSKWPTSDTYMGPSAASEPEVQAIQRAYLASRNVIAAADVHAYSQLIMWPWGWSAEAPHPHGAQYRVIGDRMAGLIYNLTGTTYTPNPITALYPASGSSADFFCSDQVQERFGRRPLSMAFELRPDARSKVGFLLPPTEIIPTGREFFAALVAYVQFALQTAS
jgi:hypothetical protein